MRTTPFVVVAALALFVLAAPAARADTAPANCYHPVSSPDGGAQPACPGSPRALALDVGNDHTCVIIEGGDIVLVPGGQALVVDPFQFVLGHGVLPFLG